MNAQCWRDVVTRWWDVFSSPSSLSATLSPSSTPPTISVKFVKLSPATTLWSPRVKYANFSLINYFHFLPRNAMLAQSMLWPCISVCPYVCHNRRSVKTTKHGITQTAPCYNGGPRDFWCQRLGEIPTCHLQRGCQI